MRNLTITQSGFSEPLIGSNSVPKEWILAVTGGINESTGLALQASVDGETWFAATNASGPVVFTAPGAVVISPGLYYRLNVATYTSAINVTIKPT